MRTALPFAEPRLTCPPAGRRAPSGVSRPWECTSSAQPSVLRRHGLVDRTQYRLSAGISPAIVPDTFIFSSTTNISLQIFRRRSPCRPPPSSTSSRAGRRRRYASRRRPDDERSDAISHTSSALSRPVWSLRADSAVHDVSRRQDEIGRAVGNAATPAHARAAGGRCAGQGAVGGPL